MLGYFGPLAIKSLLIFSARMMDWLSVAKGWLSAVTPIDVACHESATEPQRQGSEFRRLLPALERGIG